MSEAAGKPKHGRSPWRIAGMVTAVVGLIIAAIAIGGRILDDGPNLRPASEDVLRKLSTGKASEVYDQASTHFQELILEEKLVELGELMQASLGPFERTLEIESSEHGEAASGRTARVVMSLQFAKGRTTGDFSFLYTRGEWRLLGLKVKVPEEMRDQVTALEQAEARIQAPAEVIERVKRIAEHLRKGEAQAIDALASPAFRETVGVDGITEVLRARTDSMGPFVGLLDVFESVQGKDKDKAQVVALVQFERARTTARFEFIKDEGDWKLAGLKVQVPVPTAPTP